MSMDQYIRVRDEALSGDPDIWQLAFRESKRRNMREDQMRLLRTYIDRTGDRIVPPRNSYADFLGAHLCWGADRARLYAADVAERVLFLYARERPVDMRAAVAIGAARSFVDGEISRELLSEIGMEAYRGRHGLGRAARYALMAAHRVAHTKNPYEAKARVEISALRAFSASFDPNHTADVMRGWMTERLHQYLLGEVMPCW